jgi:hypothetical protein
MPALRQRLPDGPLDVIADVHGELDALLALLHRLGVDVERGTARRPLVFVGDLVDRGPDSVGVVEVFARLQDAGLAFGVLGNHELNLLGGLRREGNHWFFGDDEHAQVDGGRVPFGSRRATDDDRARIAARLATLPLVLERDDLRVVHACWHEDALRSLPAEGSPWDLSEQFDDETKADLRRRGVGDRAYAERSGFAQLKDERTVPPAALPAVTEAAVALQMRNPIKVLTSGPEEAVGDGERFFTGGKWRYTRRVRWWQAPQGPDRATVVGHYWRRRDGQRAGGEDLWHDVPPFAWVGRVLCIDYSVGRRYVERHRGRHDGFSHGLCALRWPEAALVFDDRDDAIPTTP